MEANIPSSLQIAPYPTISPSISPALVAGPGEPQKSQWSCQGSFLKHRAPFPIPMWPSLCMSVHPNAHQALWELGSTLPTLQEFCGDLCGAW